MNQGVLVRAENKIDGFGPFLTANRLSEVLAAPKHVAFVSQRNT